MNKLSNTYKGIILIIFSALFFSLMGVFVRLSGDLPAMQKAFFRNAVALVFSALFLIGKRERITLTKGIFADLLLRSAFGTAGIICNFYAVDRLVLSDASILNKMSPFFAILGSFFILKEKITAKKLVIVLTAFVGSLFVIKPGFSDSQLFPLSVGLFGGLFAGLAYTFVRKLGTQNIKGPFIVFFFSLFSCLVCLPFIISDYRPMSKAQLLYLLLAGLAASGGQFTITAAYIKAPARDISVYDYSQIVFSSLLGFFIFSQTPDIFSVIGYVIIISMAVLMFYVNRRQISAKNNA